MATGFFFNGSFSRRPRVRARVDDFGLTPFQIGSPRVVAIIGQAEGGIPKTPTLINTPTQAKVLLRKGELLDAVKLCFDPSSDNGGASLIYVVRVNPATQSTANLQDATPATTITVTSVNYGLQDNGIKVTVATGTTVGKKVTVAKGSDTYSKDNLYRESFQLQYVGAGATATMTITGTTLATTVTGGTDNLSITLASYPTVEALVAFIDAHPNYTCVVKTANPLQAPKDGLDFVTTVDIKTAPVTALATVQEIVDWLNSGQQPLLTAVRGATGKVPANVTSQYLAGGSEGTTITQDWQDSFDALQLKDIAFVVPVSSNAAIHAMAMTHCEFMSSDGSKARRAFVGAALGEKTTTLSNYTDRTSALNADRVALIAQGVKGFDADGNAITWPPYMVAAQIAGLHAGVPELGDSITHRSIHATGLEWVPSLADQEILITGGILALELVENRGFYRVVRGITTWRKNDAYNRVEISTGIALDEVVRAVLDALEIFIGQKASSILIHRVASRTSSVLREEERIGVIVGDEAHPAFDKITVTIQGDTVYVSFECSPVIPVNFIGVTINANTFAGTFTVTTR